MWSKFLRRAYTSQCCDRLHQVDLRFSEKEHEVLFKASLQRSLHISGLACNSLMVIAFIAGGFPFDEDTSLTLSESSPRTFRSWTGATLFSIQLAIASLLLLSCQCNCLKNLNWELILTIGFTLVCTGVPLNSGWVVARLYGEDPSTVWVKDMRASEGATVLSIDAINTAICLFVPIRMQLKWVPCIMGVISFSMCAVLIGSPFPQTLSFNVFALTALAAVALFGAWFNEKVARERFLAQELVQVTTRELRVQVGAKRALLAEKNAFEMLLSMVCDATMWLSQDGKTVVNCDERFDMLVGTSMDGKMLESCLSPEELVRVYAAIKGASDIPVLVPTSISPVASEYPISVDCLIVRQPQTKMTKTSIRSSSSESDLGRPEFLIGVRISGVPGVPENNSIPCDKLQALDILNGLELEANKADLGGLDKIEERSCLHSHLESVETTSTGLVFKNIAVKEEDPDAIDEFIDALPSFTEIAKLGRREGWLVEARDVSLRHDEVLGSGSFGVVVAASMHGTPVAVKVPKQMDSRLQSKNLFVVANELRILRHVRHPNIVLFFGAYLDNAKADICLIFEHIIGTALAAFLQTLHSGTQVYIRWCLLLDVACALRYLHAMRPKIVHGDLKHGNIFVEGHGLRAKLLDFGLARVLTKAAREMGGSLKWMAPEVILVPKVRPRASSDVFSFGRLVYMVLSGLRPLDRFKKETIYEMSKAGQTMPLLWPDDMPLKQSCLELCEQTSAFEQALRPTMQQVHAEISAWKHEELDSNGRLSHHSSSHTNDLHVTKGKSCHPDGSLYHIRSGRLRSPPVSQTSSGDRLALPNRDPTKKSSKILMLVMQAMQWNFPVPEDSCCLWHAALHEIYSVLDELWHRPCTVSFAPYPNWQCPSCGVLDAHDRCTVCGDEGTLTKSATAFSRPSKMTL